MKSFVVIFYLYYLNTLFSRREMWLRGGRVATRQSSRCHQLDEKKKHREKNKNIVYINKKLHQRPKPHPLKRICIFFLLCFNSRICFCPGKLGTLSLASVDDGFRVHALF